MYTQSTARKEALEDARSSESLLSGARTLVGRLFRRKPAVGTRRALDARELRSLRERFAECAAERGGVVSARQRAAELGRIYSELDPHGRRDYLLLLALEFGPDKRAVEAASAQWAAASEPAQQAAAEQALRAALRSQRSKILSQFNAIPQGVKFLVEMRNDMLGMLKQEPRLAVIESELFALLAAWFDVDFLQLQRISWNSPAALLEKLIQYEAVHQIRSWNDLRNRLDSDRRCYGLFHPRMPDEPLIFVEVALTDHLSDNIQALLDETAPPLAPERANTAIFYSISNTQPGLRGLNFGNFLIKRVVDDLSRDVPQLKTFSTLSPIPGFMAWFKRDTEAQARVRAVLQGAGPDQAAELASWLAGGSWQADTAAGAALKAPLMQACARYLVQARSEELPADPVARFHLVNGARVERINWRGDCSEKGLRQAAGMMVNYLYRKSDLESNHEKLIARSTVPLSRAVRALLSD